MSINMPSTKSVLFYPNNIGFSTVIFVWDITLHLPHCFSLTHKKVKISDNAHDVVLAYAL